MSYKWFACQRNGDCCGARLLDHFNTGPVAKRNQWGECEYKDAARTKLVYEEFTKEDFEKQLKTAIKNNNLSCFFWAQLTEYQSKFFEPGLFAVGFEKVAVGNNYNTGNDIHAYLYVNHEARSDRNSWRARTRVKEDGSDRKS